MKSRVLPRKGNQVASEMGGPPEQSKPSRNIYWCAPEDTHTFIYSEEPERRFFRTQLRTFPLAALKMSKCFSLTFGSMLTLSKIIKITTIAHQVTPAKPIVAAKELIMQSSSCGTTSTLSKPKHDAYRPPTTGPTRSRYEAPGTIHVYSTAARIPHGPQTRRQLRAKSNASLCSYSSRRIRDGGGPPWIANDLTP